MSKKGIVVAKDGSLATVQIFNNSKCLECDKVLNREACQSCAAYDENSTLRALALNDLGAEVGDRVCVAASKRQKVLFGLLSFIIPVVCAGAAYLLLSLFTDDDAIRSKTALIAFVVAMIFAGAYSYKISKTSYDYRITTITEENED